MEGFSVGGVLVEVIGGLITAAALTIGGWLYARRASGEEATTVRFLATAKGLMVIFVYTLLACGVGYGLGYRSAKGGPLMAWDTSDLRRVDGRTFKNETVKLDGKAFTNCRFEAVTFEWAGAPFDMRVGNWVSVDKSFRTPSPVLGTMVSLLCGFKFGTDDFCARWRVVGPEVFAD